MPNRIIKESICTSQQIAVLSQSEEIFFYRLLVNCDDFGLLDARPAILRAKCFPLQIDKVKDKDIEKWLLSLAKQSLIILYLVDGQPYLKMTTWEKHQRIRAQKSKYPSPETDDSILLSIDGQSLSDASVIQSNPIQSESESESESNAEKFELFWNEYPGKKEKQCALKAWNARINKKTSPDDMIKAAKNYKEDCTVKRTEQQFIKLPATFIGPNEPYKDWIDKEASNEHIRPPTENQYGTVL